MKSEVLKLDYYYGIEAEQFSFYRIPRLLIKDERFKGLSSDAKLLYGLMLDRMALSIKNGWFDDENRAYIYYTVENIMEDLGCAREKCAKVMAELDSKKGIGLIEKKRQGLGKPDIIYVKNFATLEVEKTASDVEKNAANAIQFQEVRKTNFKKSENQISRDSKTEFPEVGESNFQKFENRTSGVSENESAEIRFPNTNYNNNNYNNKSYNNQINQSDQERESRMDGNKIDTMDIAAAYMQSIKENIEYDYFMQYGEERDRELYDELYEVMCDVVCVKRKAIKVGKEEYPHELVKAKFLKLNSLHLQYVINCMKRTTTKISNIKAYMITALYNAPNTMNHYYQQEVRHDMFGGN